MKALCLMLALLSSESHGTSGGVNASATDSVVAIVDVTVIPMDSERLLPGQTVIIRDELIAEVGPVASIKVPAGARRIDGTVLYLMPGLPDAHVHLRDPGEMLSYLAHGVPTVVPLSGPVGNVPNTLDLRNRVARGAVVGPNIYAAGRILDGEPAIFPGVSTVVRTPDEAKRAVEAQLKDGVDFIKVYNNLRTDALRAVTRVAHEHGAAVWGHIPRIDGRTTALQQALNAGLDVIAHGEELFFTILYRDVESQLDKGLLPTVAEDLVRESVRLVRESGATVV